MEQINNEKLFNKLKTNFQVEGDCLLWKGFKRVQINHQYATPQRAVIYAILGHTPTGPIKLLCSNKNCVNLKHLIYNEQFNPPDVISLTGMPTIDANMFYPNKKMFQELRRIEALIGHEPNTEEWEAHSEIPLRTVKYRFKIWSKFLKESKVRVRVFRASSLAAIKESLNQEEMGRVSTELQRVAELLKHPPTEENFTNHGRFTLAKVKRVFKTKSWEEILIQVFGLPEKKRKKKPKKGASATNGQ